MAQDDVVDCLPGDIDSYGGVTIDSKNISFSSDEEFKSKLCASLEKWRQRGTRGVWVKVHIEHSSLVPICTQHGFVFHHTQPSYVMLNQWLPKEETNTLPEYANQYLGAAGFVVNDKNQLLVIQERFAHENHWKLPGGHADPGEDIADAAKREVLEETGIEAEFQGVLAFRHQHKYRYGLSDFYFICLMKPITHQIKFDKEEIHDCHWMDLDKYASHPNITDTNKHIVECYKRLMSEGQAILPTRVLSYNKKKTHLVYNVGSLDQTSSQ